MRARPAAARTDGSLLSMIVGRAPLDSRGQKYWSCRSAAEWNVRACTPPTPRARSRERISPAARVVNVTARTRSAEAMPLTTRLAVRWVMARVLPVPAPARMQTGPRRASAACRCSGSSPARTSADTAPSGDTGPSCRNNCGQGGVAHTMLTMYSTPWCGHCNRLKGALEREGVEFEVIDIEQDPAAADYVMSIN